MLPAQANIGQATFLIFLLWTVLVIVVLLSLVFYLIVKDRKSRDEVHDLKNRINLMLLQKELEDEEKNGG